MNLRGKFRRLAMLWWSLGTLHVRDFMLEVEPDGPPVYVYPNISYLYEIPLDPRCNIRTRNPRYFVRR